MFEPTGERDRDLGGELRVRDDEGTVRGERPAAASLVQEREHERRHRLAANALPLGLAQRLLDERLDVVEALVRRPGDEEAAAAELPVRPRNRRGLVGALDTRAEARPAA